MGKVDFVIHDAQWPCGQGTIGIGGLVSARANVLTFCYAITAKRKQIKIRVLTMAGNGLKDSLEDCGGTQTCDGSKVWISLYIEDEISLHFWRKETSLCPQFLYPLCSHCDHVVLSAPLFFS